MSSLDPVLLSRILTGLTLFVHIIFASIGVGVPLMIALAEWRGLRTNDIHYTLLARRWARGFVITVAVGVVTGTSIGLQLSLLWPMFMRVAGQAIALPLFMETFAFLSRRSFLGFTSIRGIVSKEIYAYAAVDTSRTGIIGLCDFHYDGEFLHEPASGIHLD